MSAPRIKSRAAAAVTAAAALALLALAGSAALTAAPATAAPAPPAPPAASPAPQGQASPAAQTQTQTPAAEPKGRVVSRLTLSIRERPTSDSAYLGGLRPGAVIALSCKVVGENVDGNRLWYRLGDGRPGYVAARYVENLSPVPYCR